ncbi:hypothetical protein EJ02DRAFT_455554 [Clathrospora elynae]|uniref:Uncharacterized protein n=1 Tax=Clathrospora elynae TaxID=706981 RepID=A0A6A5SMT7_9PLEO|nr:hypothetical protein EJ02DRAFT_455554 [Clathrospora elynae]
MAERKRRCKREDDSDTEIASEDGGETSFFESEKFLASSMRRLIDLSKYPVWRYTNNATEETEDVEEEFADIIYDSLVEEWDGPRALTLDLELKRKAELWSKQKEKSPELGKKSGGAKHEHTAAMNVPVGH